MAEKYIEAHVVDDGGQLKCILPDANFTAISARAGAKGSAGKPVKATAEIYPDETTDGYDWAPWGDDDCLPTTIRQKLYSVPMATRAIYQLTQMMYGNGIAYFNNKDLENGPKVNRAFHPAIEHFLRRNRIQTHWLPAQLMDYRFYMNCFSEMTFTRNRTMIQGIYHKKAEFSRLSVQNVKTGQIDKLYYNPNFPLGGDMKDEELREIKLFDWYNEEEFLAKLSEWKFAWHSYFPTPGTEYYARPLWMGLFKKDGWLDVSAAVPKIVSSMQHNQLIIKYHILIPESYFEIRNDNWQGLTQVQRNAQINAFINKINNSLRGVDNVYTSITSIVRQDQSNPGNMLGKVEIIPIDDKLKNDQWVPSSEKSDAQIVQGLGLHPSQIGLQPTGGKMGAGSGSDQRESFNTGISLNTLDQNIVMEPLNWLARFNAQTDPAWDVTFFIDHTHHTTTNDEESGMKPSSTTIQPQ